MAEFNIHRALQSPFSLDYTALRSAQCSSGRSRHKAPNWNFIETDMLRIALNQKWNPLHSVSQDRCKATNIYTKWKVKAEAATAKGGSLSGNFWVTDEKILHRSQHYGNKKRDQPHLCAPFFLSILYLFNCFHISRRSASMLPTDRVVFLSDFHFSIPPLSNTRLIVVNQLR